VTNLLSNNAVLATKTLQLGLLAAILATVLPYGAVHPFWFYVAASTNALVFVGTLAIPFHNREMLRVYRGALVIVLLITAYLLFQSVPLPKNAWENSVWQSVREQLNADVGTISVSPAETIAAIPQVIHPILFFMAGLVLHQTTEAALVFWRRLAFIGAGIAIFGVAQHVLSPQSLLFGTKLHYLDSVTGTFVNRNSAATLFGIASLLFTALIVRQLNEVAEARRSSGPLQYLNQHRARKILLLYLALFIVVLVAMFLTKSRGGLIATFVPLLLLAGWFGFSLAPARAAARFRLAIVAASVAIIVLLFAVLGAKTLFRIEQSGVEDNRLCVYASTIAAIKDHFWLGTGFGTFEQVFPAYRNPACGISGLWDRAHNSFLEGYLGMGLPFALIVFFAIGYLTLIFWAGYSSRRRYRVVPLVGMCSLLLIVLHSMVDFSLQIPGVAAYAGAVLSAAVSVSLARAGSGRRYQHWTEPSLPQAQM